MDNKLFLIAERYVKKVIGYPEESVPVVTTTDWIREHSGDPLRRVRNSLRSKPLLTFRQRIDQELSTKLIPYIDLDNKI